MPLVKHQEGFSELIAIAAKLKYKKHKLRLNKLTNTVEQTTRIPEESARVRSILPGDTKSKIILNLSLRAYNLTLLSAFKIARFIAVVLAFANLAYQTSNHNETTISPILSSYIDLVINFYFILDGLVHLMSLYSVKQLSDKSDSPALQYFVLFRESGIAYIVISILGILYGDMVKIGSKLEGKWLLLVRLLIISPIVIHQMPRIDVLMCKNIRQLCPTKQHSQLWHHIFKLLIHFIYVMSGKVKQANSGITYGLRPVLFTCVLLGLLDLFYGSVGYYFFNENDPYHFATIGLSMWTFFEISTLNNWSDVMYANGHGCDKYPTIYIPGNETVVLTIEGGDFYLPICSSPQARPVLSSLVFISYVILCTFMLMNLTVAAVTIGIKERLFKLRTQMITEDNILEYGTGTGNSNGSGNNQRRKNSKDRGSTGSVKSYRKAVSPTHAPRQLIMESPDSKLPNNANTLSANQLSLLRPLLMQVWSSESQAGLFKPETANETLSSHPNSSSGSSSSAKWNLVQTHIQTKRLVTSSTYFRISALLSVAAAVFEIIWFQYPNIPVWLDVTLSVLFQFLFTVDGVLHCISAYPDSWHYLRPIGNALDVTIILLLWFPIFINNKVLNLFRIFRVVRVLKMLSSVSDLSILLQSIASSSMALSYVILIVSAFFFYFAVMGVYLFAENDAYHFGTIGRALRTLLQTITFDNWKDVARSNMCGCDQVLYNQGQGNEDWDSLCDSPKGRGWWAAWYFLAFILASVFVLVNLLIAVIITSMELLKESVSEEEAVWKKVHKVQRKCKMSDATVTTLLEVFEIVDTAKSGKLTLNELAPILNIVSMTATEQCTFFMTVDRDNSGQIDFAEFCELIYDMGLTYDHQSKRGRKSSKSHKLSIPSSSATGPGPGTLPSDPRLLQHQVSRDLVQSVRNGKLKVEDAHKSIISYIKNNPTPPPTTTTTTTPTTAAGAVATSTSTNTPLPPKSLPLQHGLQSLEEDDEDDSYLDDPISQDNSKFKIKPTPLTPSLPATTTGNMNRDITVPEEEKGNQSFISNK